MAELILDTHVAIWYLIRPGRLSGDARTAMERATAAGEPLYVPAIAVVEARYLVELGRVPAEVLDKLFQALTLPDGPFVLAPLDIDVARATAQIPRAEVPELPDRIIAATALHLGLPLVTRDRRLQASAVPTLW